MKALVAGEAVAKPSHGPQSQWLTLEEWSRFADLAHVARVFMKSARALTTLPRVARKLDLCEARFVASWAQALRALRGVRVDTRQLLMVDMVLRRSLLGEVARLVLRLLVDFPIAIEGASCRKRRRLT